MKIIELVFSQKFNKSLIKQNYCNAGDKDHRSISPTLGWYISPELCLV